MKNSMSRARTNGVLALLLAAGAAGCASVSEQRGMAPVASLAGERLGQQARLLRGDSDHAALARLIDERLKSPLQADDAVQIALLNNRGLQAVYWDAGIAEAELVQAGRLRNPVFDFERTVAVGGGGLEIERSLIFNLASILTMPLAQRIERSRYEQTTLQVAERMLQHAAATRTAYIEAVAAEQSKHYALQVQTAAEASAALTERMAQVGNVSRLDLAREQVFRAETAAGLARAGQRALAAREALTRAMGLTGAAATTYSLPQRLPELPTTPLALVEVEQAALRERLDIRAATIEARQSADALGLTRSTRMINVLDLGYRRDNKDGAGARGYALSLELPLFDWGTARVARAEAIYMQALARVAHTAAVARSEARESYFSYRAAYDIARRYRDEVIPLRKKIADENLLRYNGMLISVFELLADARDQAAAVSSAIDAQKEFWIAHTKLETALGGRLPAAAPATVSKDNTP